jgi:hypothetical protein
VPLIVTVGARASQCASHRGILFAKEDLMFKSNIALMLTLCLFVSSTYAGTNPADASAGGAHAYKGERPLPRVSGETMTNLDQDLENLLLTRSEITAQLELANRKLVTQAFYLNWFEGLLNTAASWLIAFLVTREVVRLPIMYGTNGLRLSKAWRDTKTLSGMFEVEMVNESALINTSGVVGSMIVATAYVSSNLYLKGVCMISCVPSMVDKISDSQEQEFLHSPTYASLQAELGERNALRFFGIIKDIRASGFSNEDPYKLLGHWIEGMKGSKIKSFDEIGMPKAPVFSATVKIMNDVFKLDAVINDYLEKMELKAKT